MRPKAAALLFLLLSAAAPALVFAADATDLPPSSNESVEIQKLRRQSEDLLGKPEPFPRLTLEEPAAPEGQEPQKAFYVGTIAVEPNTVIPEADMRKFLAPYEEREHTVDSINSICRRIEGEYQRRGLLTIVYMAPQRLEHNKLTLTVVVSKLGEVRVEGAKYFSAEQTLRHWNNPSGSELKFEDMRAALAEMNQNPDRNVRVALKAGSQTGYTDIYLMQQDRFPLHYGFSFDNQGSKLTGKWRRSVYAVHNNFLGQDDTLLANVSMANDVASGYLYHTYPLPFWSLKLATHFSRAAVTPTKEFSALNIHGVTDDFGFELRRPALRAEHAKMDLIAGFNFNEKKTKAAGVVITRDSLRMPSFGFDYQSADPGGSWRFKALSTFGLPFHEEAVNTTSRQAGSSFAKLNVQAQRTHYLWSGTRLEAVVQAQWSPNELVPQDQLFMGGSDSVRGYPESDYGADSGGILNLEYWVPGSFIPDAVRLPYADQPLAKQCEFFAFTDFGYGQLNNPSETEHDSRRLMSAGIGTHVVWNQKIDLMLSWGIPFGDPMLSESGSSQIHLKVQTHF